MSDFVDRAVALALGTAPVARAVAAPGLGFGNDTVGWPGEVAAGNAALEAQALELSEVASDGLPLDQTGLRPAPRKPRPPDERDTTKPSGERTLSRPAGESTSEARRGMQAPETRHEQRTSHLPRERGTQQTPDSPHRQEAPESSGEREIPELPDLLRALAKPGPRHELHSAESRHERSAPEGPGERPELRAQGAARARETPVLPDLLRALGKPGPGHERRSAESRHERSAPEGPGERPELRAQGASAEREMPERPRREPAPLTNPDGDMPDPPLDWQHAESAGRAATGGVGRRTETTRSHEPPAPIRVSIGRIEVHAPTPATPAPNPVAPPQPPARTAITLDDYLARREGRK